MSEAIRDYFVDYLTSPLQEILLICSKQSELNELERAMKRNFDSLNCCSDHILCCVVGYPRPVQNAIEKLNSKCLCETKISNDNCGIRLDNYHNIMNNSEKSSDNTNNNNNNIDSNTDNNYDINDKNDNYNDTYVDYNIDSNIESNTGKE